MLFSLVKSHAASYLLRIENFWHRGARCKDNLRLRAIPSFVKQIARAQNFHVAARKSFKRVGAFVAIILSWNGKRGYARVLKELGNYLFLEKHYIDLNN